LVFSGLSILDCPFGFSLDCPFLIALLVFSGLFILDCPKGQSRMDNPEKTKGAIKNGQPIEDESDKVFFNIKILFGQVMFLVSTGRRQGICILANDGRIDTRV
jgi:hypothetical protein